jgi:hypothetical protein
MEARGYDSRDIPPSCFWVRRVVRPATSESARYAAFATAFHATYRYQPPPEAMLGFDAAAAALHALAMRRRTLPFAGLSATLRRCAGGSADGAWFALVPTPHGIHSQFFVRDARC